MIQKEFKTDGKYLHIPVHSSNPESFYYIEVHGEGICKNEFLIGISAPGEDVDFYVALDMSRYDCKKITLMYRDDNASENLFDGIRVGGKIEDEPQLYPELYNEEIRQKIHFSPKRGWMNDPNGLFFKDGIFHMYFQHNPFSNHHFSTNVSWGHSTSTDGVHFKEHNDVIMPRNSRLHIASGSAIVDRYNISGMGEDTVLAAYTDLPTIQYHGRSDVTTGMGQNLLYSKNDGFTYTYFDKNPIINVPDYKDWRDPKILQLDKETLCIAVYETFEDKNCISFYKSGDCVNWEFCSRIMNLYECPDLFLLNVKETGEKLWGLYGASGKYKIGVFENYEYRELEEPGYIDYGDCVYAGQTFNNYIDSDIRLYMAWMRDHEHTWNYVEGEPNKSFGFSQSMSLMTELSLHKTADGYRLFRKPVSKLKSLRKNSKKIVLNGNAELPVPSELVFEMDKNKDFSITVCGKGFSYNGEMNEFTTTSKKQGKIHGDGKMKIRIFADTRTIEIFVNDEVGMSFSQKFNKEKFAVNGVDGTAATLFELDSILK